MLGLSLNYTMKRHMTGLARVFLSICLGLGALAPNGLVGLEVWFKVVQFVLE